MSQAPSVAFTANEEHLVGSPASEGPVSDPDRHEHCVSLKGTTRGLEILISGTPTTAVLAERLTELLAEAPSFFAGSDARVAIDGALPSGALACLEEVATRFALRIVEISPLVARRRRPETPRALRPEDILPVGLPVGMEDGSGPVAGDVVVACTVDPISRELAGVPSATPVAAAPDAITSRAIAPDAAAPNAGAPNAVAPQASAPDAATELAERADDAPPGPRLVVGPLRSGMVVEHPGHLVVIGDVNPGAEIRAEGSIIVLGRMRGVAHAAIGRDGGFIVALSLQPQQLRIGRMVARAGDADRPGDGAEIAYATGETIVVERFLGRLPSGLAASM